MAFLGSPSSRRAWIEIIIYQRHQRYILVALLAEGVDRNNSRFCATVPVNIVALLAEGVDRNLWLKRLHLLPLVALLAEGVDRNKLRITVDFAAIKSPSSRRAWIEIDNQRLTEFRPGSPSSRRAWIEIQTSHRSSPQNGVALLAEGVDRNRLGHQAVCPPGVALLAEGVDRNLPQPARGQH